MIFRLSGKLQKKIKVIPKESFPADVNPFTDWSATVFTAGRTQLLLVTNTASLYSFIVQGRGITNSDRFTKESISMMRQTLKNDGFEQIFDEYILPATGNILYSKALNRSVTGSMNEFVYYAINRLIDGGLAPNAVSSILNETFMSYIDYKYPKEAFRSLSFQEIGVITGENVDDG